MRLTPQNVTWCVLLLWSAMVLYRAPYYASNMETVPDSVEYVTMGWRAAREGRITLPIEGRELPSRYQPWFSLTVLAPVYWLRWTEPGDGIWPVWLLSLVGVAFGLRLACVAGGLRALFAAAVLLLVGTDYVIWGRKILTDAPATALVLAAAYLYSTSDSLTRRIGRTFVESLLLAVVMLWRPAFVLFVLPFAYRALRNRAWAHVAVYAMLIAATVILQLAYNLIMFGNPLRNGYVFWCAQVFGVGKKTFSWFHVWPNFQNLTQSRVGVVWLMSFLGFFTSATRRAWKQQNELKEFGRFLVFGALPFVFLHLFYFFRDTRFFLPVSALLAIVAGIHVGTLAERIPGTLFRWGATGMLILTAGWRLVWYTPIPPPRRIATDMIAAHTPSNAVVVSAIDPVYLQLMSGYGTCRRFIPVSRDVEYASKQICANWLRRDPVNVMEPGVHYVALEQVTDLQDRVRRGEPVFVETRLAEDYGLMPKFDEFCSHFQKVPVAEHLWRLVGTTN